MCIVIKSWTSTWVFLSIQIGFPFTSPNLIFLKSKNCFPVAPCTLCFSSILFNQDGLGYIYICFTSLHSPTRDSHQDERWHFWLLLDWRQLWEFLGFTILINIRNPPKWTNMSAGLGRRYQENLSPDFFRWPTRKIFRHYEEGKLPMNFQCILSESLYMMIYVYPNGGSWAWYQSVTSLCIQGLSLASPQAAEFSNFRINLRWCLQVGNIYIEKVSSHILVDIWGQSKIGVFFCIISMIHPEFSWWLSDHLGVCWSGQQTMFQIQIGG